MTTNNKVIDLLPITIDDKYILIRGIEKGDDTVFDIDIPHKVISEDRVYGMEFIDLKGDTIKITTGAPEDSLEFIYTDEVTKEELIEALMSRFAMHDMETYIKENIK